MTLRPWCGAILGCGLALVLGPAFACGTDAVGVEDCRQIEQARCRAAAGCDEPVSIDDVETCEQFYRDHCLHGLSGPERPGAPLLDACVGAIDAAGRCVNEDGPDTPIEDCSGVEGSGLSVCEFLANPEKSPDCGFLLEEAEDEDNDGDDGAAGSRGDDSGGDAGSAGDSDAGAAGGD